MEVILAMHSLFHNCLRFTLINIYWCTIGKYSAVVHNYKHIKSWKSRLAQQYSTFKILYGGTVLHKSLGHHIRRPKYSTVYKSSKVFLGGGRSWLGSQGTKPVNADSCNISKTFLYLVTKDQKKTTIPSLNVAGDPTIVKILPGTFASVIFFFFNLPFFSFSVKIPEPNE